MPIITTNPQAAKEAAPPVATRPVETPVTASMEDPPRRTRRRTPAPPPPKPAAQTDKEDNYVGYKHPPKQWQFEKGKSGNPKGRPKGAKGMKTIVRTLMTGKVEVRTSAGIVRMTRMEAALHKFMELALKGNPRALIQLIALYGQAVPDEETARPLTGSEELTPADEAIIAAFTASIRESQGGE